MAHFWPSVVDRPLDRVLQRSAGTIDSSLYVSARAAGMPNQVLMEMVHIFSFDVDFQREIQRGNRFEVLYEAVFNRDGEFVENGPILYAKLEVGEREVELFRYEPDEGPADYLDAKGASVRKALMRTPINGARLSSGYGMRKHPILGYNKKHLGVDFAAPIGTPIYAGGDGTITMIGWHGNYGKYVRVRHNSTYSTGYAHLSGYAKGMKKGKRVPPGAGHRLRRLYRNVDRASPSLRSDAGQQADQPDDAQAALRPQAEGPRAGRVSGAGTEDHNPDRRGAGGHARRPALTDNPYAAMPRWRERRRPVRR